jgi:mono/diheme cytochrome c family protein
MNTGVTAPRACVALCGIAALLTGFAALAQNGAADLARGEQVYTHWCAACHSAGPNMPGTQALEAKYNGNPAAVLIERADVQPELIKAFVRSGVSVMPPFRKTEIGDADLDALAAYIVTTARQHGSAR